MATAVLTTDNPDSELLRLGNLYCAADVATAEAVAKIEALKKARGVRFSLDPELAAGDEEALHALREIDGCADEIRQLSERIEATPARTAEGLRVKLEFLALSEGRPLETLLNEMAEGRPVDPPGPLVSLLRDIRNFGECRS